MLKKLFFIFLALNLFTAAFAQIKAPLEFVGKNKGKIQVLLRQDSPFVAARTFGRALGMQSTYYGASGRLELAYNNKKAELQKQKNYVIINKQRKPLTAAPFEQDNILYAPLSFFQDFSAYDVSFKDNKLIAQRRYTLAFSQQIDKEDFSQLVFFVKGELPFRVEKSTKDKVEIFLPGAVVKYDEVVSSKNNFLHRVRISQKAKGVQIAALLKKNAKNWDFYYNGRNFVFEASLGAIKRTYVKQEEISSSASDTKIEPLRPSVLKEEEISSSAVLAEDSEEIIELGDDFFAAGSQIQAEVFAPQKTKPAPTLVPVAKNQNKGKLKVLIDPGHGGKDPGAMRKGSAREKELNLKVAKQIYDILGKEKYVEVKMTRQDDTFISLGDRAKMSTQYDADIFVSVHTNAAKKSTASGFEVYFRSDKASDAEAAQTAALENEALQYEGKTSAGLSFADLLLQSLATNENINQSSKLAAHIRMLASKESGKTGIKVFNNSAIKQANFYVLRGVSCPAVLVEMGYISNPSDRKRLNNKNTQTLIAKTIAKGILTYAKEEGWK